MTKQSKNKSDDEFDLDLKVDEDFNDDPLDISDLGNDESLLSLEFQELKDIDIEESVVQEIFKRSRPKQKENRSSHRRLGSVGGFRSKFNEETIESLNRKLENVLVRFQYKE